MKLFLIRHARAEKRSDWDGPAPLRPLTPRGLRQARSIAEALAGEGIERIVSSPHLRCRQTVEPLAAALGLPVELDERLAEGERAAKALELVRELGARPAICCGHGDLIPALVAELEERGAQLRFDGALECEKGGAFLVEGAGAAPERVSYRRAPAAELDDAAEDRQRVGVLDLGSTSFRLVVFDATASGRLVPVSNEHTMLRLGAAIALDGRIAEDVGAQAVETARGLAEHAREVGMDRLLPVATAALRDAENGRELCERIGAAVGEPVRRLSGEEEARLIFAAFRRRVLLGSGNALGLDLGGGSLELAVGDTQRVHWEATLRIGVTRLHRQLVAGDPMRRREARDIADQVRAELTPHAAAIRAYGVGCCVAAGGSARGIARLVVARRGLRPNGSVNQLSIPREELHELTAELVRSSHDERLRMPGMRRNRADLLPTAGVVLGALADELGMEALTVSDWGLREGVVLEILARPEAAQRAEGERSSPGSGGGEPPP